MTSRKSNPADGTLKAVPAPSPAAALVRVERETLHDKVYFQLSEALRQGQLEMGHALTLRALAALLGVSVMPVRDAVSRLVNEGALEMLANRQVRVPMLTVGQYLALIEARVAAEGHAAFLAASRIGKDGLRELASANMRLLQASRARDHTAIMQANRDVHFGIYRAARSPKLLQIIENLWQQSGPYLASIETAMASSAAMKGHDFGAHQHDQIYDALVKGDAAVARAALVEDIQSFAQIYRDLLLHGAAPDGAVGNASV